MQQPLLRGRQQRRLRGHPLLTYCPRQPATLRSELCDQKQSQEQQNTRKSIRLTGRRHRCRRISARLVICASIKRRERQLAVRNVMEDQVYSLHNPTSTGAKHWRHCIRHVPLTNFSRNVSSAARRFSASSARGAAELPRRACARATESL